MNEISAEELHKGIAAFLMCFGAGLPAALKASIRDRTYTLADQIEHGGKATVARLARGFADALAIDAPMPPSH